MRRLYKRTNKILAGDVLLPVISYNRWQILRNSSISIKVKFMFDGRFRYMLISITSLGLSRFGWRMSYKSED